MFYFILYHNLIKTLFIDTVVINFNWLILVGNILTAYDIKLNRSWISSTLYSLLILRWHILLQLDVYIKETLKRCLVCKLKLKGLHKGFCNWFLQQNLTPHYSVLAPHRKLDHIDCGYKSVEVSGIGLKVTRVQRLCQAFVCYGIRGLL